MYKVPTFAFKGNLFEKAIDKWGAESQTNMMQEECAELIVEINHFRRGRSSHTKVAKEMADVAILIEQMKLLFGEDEFNKHYDENLKNLEERLK